MSEDKLSRRKILGILGAGGILAISSNLSPSQKASLVGGQTPGNGNTEGNSSQESPKGNQSHTETLEGERIEDYGATVDGKTDDTNAIMRAVKAAAPDGRVLFPPGDVLISGKSHPRGRAMQFGEATHGVTLEGAGTGPAGTRLVMAGGHSSVHVGIDIEGSDSQPAQLTIRNLRLDGNGLAQDYRVGLGILVNGQGEQNITVENVLIHDWAVNGIATEVGGVTVRNSTLHHNGHRSREDGYNGHGIASDIHSGPGRTVADRVLCTQNTGNGLDNSGGKLTVRNSVIRNNTFGIKLNETTEEVRIENCRIVNTEITPIHNVPGDTSTGRLIMRNSIIDRAGWPGIYSPAGGTFEGDGIVIRRTNQVEDRRAGVVFIDEGKEIDVGEMSIHGTAGSGAVYFENCSGSIDRLIRENNAEGLGKAGKVNIESVESGNPLSVVVPTAADVGARYPLPLDT